MEALVNHFWHAVAHAIILAHVSQVLSVSCDCFGVVPVKVIVKGHTLVVLSGSSVFLDGMLHTSISAACHAIALETPSTSPDTLRSQLACLASVL